MKLFEHIQQLEIKPMTQEERMGRQQIRVVAYVVGVVSLMNNAKSLSWGIPGTGYSNAL